TSYPAASSRSARLLPMKPATPVTTTRAPRMVLTSERVAGAQTVLVEHRDGLARELLQVLPAERELRQQVRRQDDHVDAAGFRLVDVEDFARARPQHLQVRTVSPHRDGGSHQ